ncbi:glutamate--tRNA ligase [Candidatus Micrarchaeota archaeon]|nr:glutamate--tRNA ligase [Candidatus Micrarchaeota archaeon]
MDEKIILNLSLKYGLKNAFDYGKADVGSVVGKVIAEYPNCKKDMKKTMQLISETINEINKMNKIDIGQGMKEFEYPEIKQEREGLPDLEFAKGIGIVTRIAPNPGGMLTLGHAKQSVICDEYAKKYNGKFIVRLEDTDPKTKKPVLEAYESIPKNIEWLGCKIHEIFIQSERMEIYYEYAEKLIGMGKAYVCKCPADIMRKNREEGLVCECRNRTIKENKEEWEKMKTIYTEGEAVLRIKTSMDHPNASVRDWPAMRIITEPHILQKNKYRVWPLYNLSCPIDDHLMGITFVMRGKEHELNTIKQKYIYDYFGWDLPHFKESGILKLSDKFAHKSDIRKAIADGEISGWDDIQLPTLDAMKRRGIKPEAIRKYMINIGIRPVDSKLDWDILFKYNTELIKDEAEHLMFVQDPVEIDIESDIYYISKKDYDDNINKEVRLKQLMNIKISNKKCDKLPDKKSKSIKTINWVKENVDISIITSRGEKFEGKTEKKVEFFEVDKIVYFEKIGFARLDDEKEMLFVLSY